MLACTVPATVDMTSVTSSSARSIGFINRSFSADAPWQMATLNKLHELATLTTVPDRDADLVPAESTFMFARLAIAKLQGLPQLPNPVVCPVSGGSIGMIWKVSGKQLEVIFDDDYLGSWVLSQGQTILGDGDIDGESTSQLKMALGGLLRA